MGPKSAHLHKQERRVCLRALSFDLQPYYSPKCLEEGFSEVASFLQLCYLVCKRSGVEREGEEVAHEALHHIGHGGPAHDGDASGERDSRVGGSSATDRSH
jgi:hypothetical protein